LETHRQEVMECAAGCCRVLQGVAGCCRVLQRIAWETHRQEVED